MGLPLQWLEATAQRRAQQRQPMVLDADAVECKMGNFTSALAEGDGECCVLNFKMEVTEVVG
jgi:hypothetical protein